MVNRSASAASKAGTAVMVVLIIGLVGVLGYRMLQKAGVIAGVPIDAQIAAKVAGPYQTSKPNPKNMKAYVDDDDDPSVKQDAVEPSRWKIIDVHEHAQNVPEAERLLAAMDQLGVQRTCLLSATIYTFTLNDAYGFEQFKENNEEVIKIKKRWPDRFCAFVTFDPLAEGNLELVKDAVSRGADGVKLYIGHGAKTGKGPFHVMGIDDPRLEPFWAWAEEVQLPVLMHVNLIKYWDETVTLLEKHPNLRLCLPHFGLHKNTDARLKRLGWLLDRYPNVYSDMSYGHPSFQVEGFESLSKWRSRTRTFLKRYAHRLMFASDMVLEATKTEDYIIHTLRSYRQWNESERFRLYLVPSKLMHGMDLDDDSLAKIYEQAPAGFLLLDAKGNLPDRTKDPKVTVPMRVLPLIDKETIPFDPQYVPRTDGPTWASSAKGPAAKKAGGDVVEGGETKGGGGEGPEEDADAEHDCD
ncbi:MAG: amidohydrolase family protein [Deltaproteobacteria bacterium]|nr:amidohydrolase family protein [Deltaproteobacteria bacterium]